MDYDASVRLLEGAVVLRVILRKHRGYHFADQDDILDLEKIRSLAARGVVVLVKGNEVTYFTDSAELTFRKKVSRAVGLSLQQMRRKAASAAYVALLEATMEAAKAAVTDDDLRNLQAKIVDGIAREQATALDNRRRTMRSDIRRILSNRECDIELPELTEMWNECVVEEVLGA